MDVKIDEEFQLLCPPLSDDERQMLEDSILESGMREPLCVWDGVIVDGHHRYSICKKHKLKFKVHEITLTDRKHARQWIIENQMARRNLSPLQASCLRGKFYNMHKLKPGGGIGKTKGVEPHGSTHEWVAERFKVSPSTVLLDAELADAVEELHPEARQFVMNKATIARRAHVVDLAKLDHESQLEVVAYLERERRTLSEVMLELRGPRKTGLLTSKCKTCGAKLSPGIVTCLKCDIAAGDVKEKLKPKSKQGRGPQKPLGEDDDRYQGEIAARIAEARAAKQSQDEIAYHSDWLISAINTSGVRPNSLGYKSLAKLHRLLNETMNKSGFVKARA